MPKRDRGAIVALAILVAIGFGLRLALMRAQSPGFIGITDSIYYIIAGHHGVFQWAVDPRGNPWPAGYPSFLRAVHVLDGRLSFAIQVQHYLGIGTALLLFLMVRRVAPAVWGLLPAAVVLLAGPQLFLEHAPMTEPLYAFLIVAFMYCGVRALDERPALWGSLAGLLAAAAATVRVAGLPFIAMVVVLLFVGSSRGLRGRVTGAVAAGLAATVLIGVYLVEMKHETGFGGPGLTKAGQWSAPTRARQEPASFVRRLGSDLTRFWSSDRNHIDTLSHEYVRVSGYDYDGLIRILQTPSADAITETTSWYPTGTPSRNDGTLDVLRAYERHTRLEGVPFMLLLLLAVAGLPFARGQRLTVGVFALATALVTLITPIAYVYFDARYAIPGYGPLTAAGALGGATLWERYAARRSSSPRVHDHAPISAKTEA